MTKGLSLETNPGFLVPLLTHRPQIPLISGFPDYFSFTCSFETSFVF